MKILKIIFRKLGINSRIKRIIFFVNIVINRKNEHLFTFEIAFKYLFNNSFYPLNKYRNYTNKFHIYEDIDFFYINYNEYKYTYPKSCGKQKILNNFNAIINEQDENSPHKYNIDVIKSNWVIYDIGTAEGYQVNKWLKNKNNVVLFEPDEQFYEGLLITFSDEIKNGIIRVINFGVSNQVKEKKINGKILKFNSLINLINKYNLPKPDYIKVDIEGDELDFLAGSKELFEKGFVKYIQIATYHKPNDFIDIPNLLSNYKGKGHFSPGIIVINIDTWNNVGTYKKLLQPVIRKCLYSYKFYQKN